VAKRPSATAVSTISIAITSGSGVAVGSGSTVGSEVGVAAGAQAAKTRATTINNMGITVKRFILF
jgi:hypothetical protein